MFKINNTQKELTKQYRQYSIANIANIAKWPNASQKEQFLVVSKRTTVP